ncbi:hypothetical protein D3C77_395590 [compost metagenome]
MLEDELQRLRVVACGHALPVVQFGIAPEHLEAGADLMDAVVQGLQLGRLVDHVFGAGDLAAVMQPGGDPELITFHLTHAVLRIRTTLRGDDLVDEHFRQLRDSLTVTAGVRALGIRGVGQELDDGVQQALLGFDQLACLDSHGRGPRQFLDKAAERLLDATRLLLVRPQLQHQNAQALLATVVQGDRQVLRRAL